MSVAPEPHNTDKLESWKEITAYFGRDVRTVQRWERAGIPIRRYALGKKNSVYALKTELQTWFEAMRSLGTAEFAPASTPAPAKEEVRNVVHGRILSVKAVIACVAICVFGMGVWLVAVRPSPDTMHRTSPARIFVNAISKSTSFFVIPLGAYPSQLALTPDEDELYVSDVQNGTVSVIRTRDRSVTSVLKVGGRPFRLVVAPDGKRVYVGNAESGLAIIETANKSIRLFPTEGNVADVAVTSDGRKIFLTLPRNGLKKLDPASLKLSTIGGTVCPMYLAASGQHLYVSSRCGGPGGRAGHDAIDIIDIQTEKSVGIISGPPLVGGPLQLSIDEKLLLVDGTDACHASIYDRAGCPQFGGIAHVFRVADRLHLKSFGSPRLNFWFTNAGENRAILFNQDWTTVIDTNSWKESERATIFSEGGVLTRDYRTLYLTLPREKGVGVLSIPSGDCEPPRLGLVHQYTGDGITVDAAGGYDLEPNPGIIFGPALVGQGFVFDGNKAFLASRAPQGLNDPFWGESGTVALWIKVHREQGVQPILTDSWASGVGLAWRILQTADGRLNVEWRNGQEDSTLQSAVAIGEDSWHHLLVVKKGQQVRLYLDAVLQAEGKFSGTAVRPSSPSFLVGTDPTHSGFFHGILDEIVVYNRHIELDEIRRLYSAGQPPCTAGK